MRNEDRIRRAYDYVQSKAEDGLTFNINDLSRETGWTSGTTRTYISKKLVEVVTNQSGGTLSAASVLTVERRILDVSYVAFKRLFRQKNTLFVNYEASIYPDVTTYEFFLPLSCEDVLRAALDRLFYKDTVIHRLQQIGLDKVREVFEVETNESDIDYLNRIAKLIGNKFGGYSVSHVNGRFRAAELMTREEATNHEKNDGGYIIDETTAVVRFILPHQSTATGLSALTLDLTSGDINDEIAKTHWLFTNLFVYAVTQATTNQDEIWLLETGKNHRLFRYVSEDRD